MDDRPARTRSWEPAPVENFTGRSWFGPIDGDYNNPLGVVVLGVLFEPGARTDWHSHPGGQTLFVDSGSGIVVNDAGAVVEVGPGDAVAIPPGETHWHGATESSYMMHISITAGGPTSWNGQKVSEEQYRSVRGG